MSSLPTLAPSPLALLALLHFRLTRHLPHCALREAVRLSEATPHAVWNCYSRFAMTVTGSVAVPSRNSDAEDYCGVFLAPAMSAALPVTVVYSFEFAVMETSQRKLRDPVSVGLRAFSLANDEAWGWPKALAWKVVKELDAAAQIVITVIIKQQDPISPPHIPLALCNNPHYGNVAFHFASADAWIFGLKPVLVERSAHFRSLLSSDFAEGFSNTLLDPKASFNPPSDKRAGDLDELGEVFWCGGASAAIEVEEALETVSSSTHSDEATSDSEMTTNPDASSSRTNAEQPAPTSAPAELKRYHRIQVHDCSYSTFLAYLYWIYYGEISFAPSRATELANSEEQPESQDSPAVTPPAETDESPSPPPCNAHAMYRLADRYLHDGLCEIAKSAIVSGLTPETAAYEAFSALSRDYEDLQVAVIEFIVKNIQAVRASSGWTRMLRLIGEGGVAGGVVVLDKILEGVTTAAEAKDAKEA
uniref:FGENESH: predicted gene_15.16 protein n=2 Tax=Rhodotorula toruloides TaxID=5286 RepID=A0A0K3CMJ0_RHOTO